MPFALIDFHFSSSSLKKVNQSLKLYKKQRKYHKKMVRLIIKRGDEAQFIFDTRVTTPISTLLPDLLSIYNARLKVGRLAAEIRELAAHGTTLPPNMIGLTEEQVEELRLVDEWAQICIPSGGFLDAVDPIGRRNGQGPLENMANLLLKTVAEAKEAISKKLVEFGTPLTLEMVQEQIRLMEGAVRIVYPMNIPPHDPIRMEFENREELEGTQDSLEVLNQDEAQLWFCGKEIVPGVGKLELGDFIGKNEKSKVVLKLGKKGSGPPGREPQFTEEEKKQMMLHAYRKQEEAKKFAEQEESGEGGDGHWNSEWADGAALKRSFHGVQNVSWRPK